MTPAAPSSRPDTAATGSRPRPDAISPPASGRSVPAAAARLCPTARALGARRPRTADPLVSWPTGGGSAATGPARPAPPSCADRAESGYERSGSTRLDDPGDLIAAVPAMLGFEPQRSLVVAVLCGAPGAPASAVVDLVVRFDLRHPERPGSPCDTDTVAAAVARVCARPGVVGVLVVVVDDEAAPPEPPLRHRIAVLDELEGRLAARAVPIRGSWAVRSIRAGEPWWSLTGPDHRGRVADPATSVLTLDRVFGGRPIRGSRAELTASIGADAVLRGMVSAELPGARSRAKDRYAAAARREDPVGFLRGELVTLLWLISQAESGSQLGARELADIAVALRDSGIRDCMFALAGTVHADAAEQLWIRLTRGLEGADRAESATLLGYFAYVRGDGPFAGIALDAAVDADPRHPMATLLHTALEAGMRPQRLRDLARCGRDTAADLGVDLETQW